MSTFRVSSMLDAKEFASAKSVAVVWETLRLTAAQHPTCRPTLPPDAEEALGALMALGDARADADTNQFVGSTYK
jgi:hypothetical protein